MLAPGTATVIQALWREQAPPQLDDATLQSALEVARRNEVSGRLARLYPERLQAEHRRVAEATEAFRGNLEEACSRLVAAGVRPVLIKADLAGDYVYGNFDLVVGDDGWDAAVRALHGWAVRSGTHPLERGKLLLYPKHGPAAHLHRHVSWFSVPVIAAEELRAQAISEEPWPWLVPDQPDAFRITLGHAAFQNLALGLAELLALRSLLDGIAATAARQRAAGEGWEHGFEAMRAFARDVTSRLDRGEAPSLPVALPSRLAWRVGAEHALSRWARGQRAVAVWELLMRPALIAAKRRRLHQGM